MAVRQAALKDRQLDTEVRKPADAERYRVETAAAASRQSAILEADAKKAAAIAAAEADAEKARLTGEGDKSRRAALAEAVAIEGAKAGEAEKARRVAEADAVRAEGEATASAIAAKGTAEAEAMHKKADAYGRYNQAAVLEMLVSVLPSIAKEVAAPMASIDKLTVISADGANELPKQVGTNVVQVLEMLKSTTGIDLQSLAARYTSTPSTEAGAVEAKRGTQ